MPWLLLLRLLRAATTLLYLLANLRLRQRCTLGARSQDLPALMLTLTSLRHLLEGSRPL